MSKWFTRLVFAFFVACALGKAQGINAGGGINIPASAGTTITPQTCGGGQAITAAAANGTFTCGAVGGGGSSRGLFASAPTCNAGASGTTYFATDADLQGQCNGTSWQWFYAQIPAVPTSISGSSTWFNQSTLAAQASVANTSGGAGVIFTGGQLNGSNVQGRLRAYPATPFTYIVCMQTFTNPQFTEVGMMATDGTNIVTSKIVSWAVSSTGVPGTSFIMSYVKWTNATTASASYTPTPAIASYYDHAVPKCFGYSDNGTTRKVRISFNKNDWMNANFADVTNTEFVTPTNIGYYSNSNGGQGNTVSLIFSEEVVASALF